MVEDGSEAFERLAIHLPPWDAAALLGLVNAVFLGLFVAGAARVGMDVVTTAVAVTTGLVVAVGVALGTGAGVPAIPFMTAGLLRGGRPQPGTDVRKPRSSRSNAAGASMLTTWPTPGSSTSREPGIAACSARPTAGDDRASRPPWITSTGTSSSGSTGRRSAAAIARIMGTMPGGAHVEHHPELRVAHVVRHGAGEEPVEVACRPLLRGPARLGDHAVQAGADLLRRQRARPPGVRADQDERPRKPRVPVGHLQGKRPAPRQAAEVGPAEAEGARQAGERVRVRAEVRAGRGVGAPPAAGRVPGDDVERVRQALELAEPLAAVAPAAVQQHHRRPGPGPPVGHRPPGHLDPAQAGVHQSQPRSSATRIASMRLRTPVLAIAADR